jgi:hypothetical protein
MSKEHWTNRDILLKIDPLKYHKTKNRFDLIMSDIAEVQHCIGDP